MCDIKKCRMLFLFVVLFAIFSLLVVINHELWLNLFFQQARTNDLVVTQRGEPLMGGSNRRFSRLSLWKQGRHLVRVPEGAGSGGRVEGRPYLISVKVKPGWFNCARVWKETKSEARPMGPAKVLVSVWPERLRSQWQLKKSPPVEVMADREKSRAWVKAELKPILDRYGLEVQGCWFPPPPASVAKK